MTTTDPQPYTFLPDDMDRPEAGTSLRSAILQALGTASVAWTEGPRGVFQEDVCLAAAAALEAKIGEEWDRRGVLRLTTAEVFGELIRRLDMAQVDGAVRILGDLAADLPDELLGQRPGDS